MTSGVHHLYVETRDWDLSLAFWKALGFGLDEGWGIQQRDGILSPVDGSGPYVFLRLAPDDQDDLPVQVVFGAPDLDLFVEADGVLVDRRDIRAGGDRTCWTSWTRTAGFSLFERTKVETDGREVPSVTRAAIRAVSAHPPPAIRDGGRPAVHVVWGCISGRAT